MADEFDETPWTERQWEAFLRESELRAARFGDLFETLLDHPDRDELIAREMGWKGDREAPEFELPEEEETEEDEPDEDVLEEEVLEDIAQKKSRLRALPAYSAGRQWGLRVCKALENVGELDAEPDEIMSRAIEGGLSVAAKIAAGHALGDDDQALCGNIVCCRRAAAFAQQGIDALAELAQRGCVGAEAIQPLVEEGHRVRLLVEQQIGELRSRVWWE